MLPLNQLSTEPVVADFLYPDNRPFNTREDWELGGIAHQDPSQGLRVQAWRCWWEAGAIYIVGEDYSTEPIKVVDTAGATYVSLAFDHNMRVTVAWMWQGYMYLYWYNSQVSDYVTDVFPGNCPRLSHDDKRPTQVAISDVVFFYLYQGYLCCRNQRERYLVEHRLGPVPPKVALLRTGMTTNYRMRIEAIQTGISWG